MLVFILGEISRWTWITVHDDVINLFVFLGPYLLGWVHFRPYLVSKLEKLKLGLAAIIS
jgi:hypothetical protein